MLQCRQKKLIIDLQTNPGGSVVLGYDTFTQLFPDIFPHGAGALCAHNHGRLERMPFLNCCLYSSDNFTALGANRTSLTFNVQSSIDVSNKNVLS